MKYMEIRKEERLSLIHIYRIDKMLEDGVLEIIQDAPKGETNYRRILRKRMK